MQLAAKHILINAANLTGAGAKSLGESLLPVLVRKMPDSSFSILLPEEWRLRCLELPANANIYYVSTKSGIWNNCARLKQLFFDIRRVAEKTHANVCLTLGDLAPVGLRCAQVVFLHQPLLVYSPDELDGKGGWSRAKRLYLTKYFGWASSSARYIVVQTDVMYKRVIERYRIDSRKVVIIPQPVPQHVAFASDTTLPPVIRENTKPTKLLFLASHYPHKNHEILPAVAMELRRRDLVDRVRIFTTIDIGRISSAKLRDCLRLFPDVITNIGPVKMEEVAVVLAGSSALFLPTIVESYGLVYLEAMASGLPILTSDRDFAHHMCGDAAQYFDPLDARSIVDCIEKFCGWKRPDDYALEARSHLSRFPSDWSVVAEMFSDVLRRASNPHES